MPELTLERIERRLYALGDVGTLRSLPRHRALIEAEGEAWRLTRTAGGFGQIINATDATSNELVARYVPRGFLHLRGIYAGELHAGERSFDWRGRRWMSQHFTLTEAGTPLAEFDAAVSTERPARVTTLVPRRIPPLTLLFCCFLCKQVVDTVTAGAVMPAATAGGY